MRHFKVVKAYMDQNIELPKRATNHSAGYDLSSAIEVVIQPGEVFLVPTGIKCLMPSDEALFVYARSSLGLKKGLMMSNGVGIIDSDYYDNEANEGHIFVSLYNFRTTQVTIKAGERIAQGVFIKFQKTSDDQTNQARNGGFGSSGTF